MSLFEVPGGMHQHASRNPLLGLDLCGNSVYTRRFAVRLASLGHPPQSIILTSLIVSREGERGDLDSEYALQLSQLVVWLNFFSDPKDYFSTHCVQREREREERRP